VISRRVAGCVYVVSGLEWPLGAVSGAVAAEEREGAQTTRRTKANIHTGSKGWFGKGQPSP
jgi:hypothetical protein